MHNLHFVVVNAETAKQACDTAESHIDGFGTEDNWKTICGCVSEENEVLDLQGMFGGGRWKPSETGYTTIAKINKIVKGWIKANTYSELAEKKLANAKGKINLKRWNTSELYSLKALAEQISQQKYLGKSFSKFNVLEDEFFSGSYDECGVTHCQDDNDTEGYKKYVVFVDMHS